MGSGEVFGRDDAAEEFEKLRDFSAVGAGGFFASEVGLNGDGFIDVVATIHPQQNAFGSPLILGTGQALVRRAPVRRRRAYSHRRFLK